MSASYFYIHVNTKRTSKVFVVFFVCLVFGGFFFCFCFLFPITLYSKSVATDGWWWYMPLILALLRQRQVDLLSLRPAWATQSNPVLKNKRSTTSFWSKKILLCSSTVLFRLLNSLLLNLWREKYLELIVWWFFQASGKNLNLNDESQHGLLMQLLKLTHNCLNFDFIGTSTDESSDDLCTVQIPTSWRSGNRELQPKSKSTCPVSVG